MNIIQQIEQQRAEVSEAADGLRKRIEKAEEFFTNLPGRVSTTWDCKNFRLHLLREGKAWKLHYSLTKDGPTTALADASLAVKLEAVKAFHALLMSVSTSQRALAAELNAANQEVDQFLEQAREMQKASDTVSVPGKS